MRDDRGGGGCPTPSAHPAVALLGGVAVDSVEHGLEPGGCDVAEGRVDPLVSGPVDPPGSPARPPRRPLHGPGCIGPWISSVVQHSSIVSAGPVFGQAS